MSHHRSPITDHPSPITHASSPIPHHPSLITIHQLKNLDNLILAGILMTLFFMPLHEKLKAAGFWMTLALWFTKLVKNQIVIDMNVLLGTMFMSS